MLKQRMIRKVAVLGAGVMGAQIAAQLVNANVPTVLFDLPSQKGSLNDIVTGAVKRLGKLKPAPLMSKAKAGCIQAANYEQDLALLSECDLIIEAIAERLDWKQSLYEKVVPYINSDAVFVTNTSGLSIDSLAAFMPENLRTRFCGMHFFNPPRYMKLVELIPTPDTHSALLDDLETFLVTTLGKSVIHAKDTPNFIANRVGVFAMLSIMHHGEQCGLNISEVDAVTGALLGRPKSATYRLADVVGLDTLGHVVNTMQENLPSDPWHAYYQLPQWIQTLIEHGALGQKSGAGVYRKQGKVIQVFDPTAQDYVDANANIAPEVLSILKQRDAKARLMALRESSHPQAQFIWLSYADLFAYAAFHLSSIANTVRDVDCALRWGFGWKQGVFETWQQAGWSDIRAAVADDMQAGKLMVQVTLPEWVKTQAEVYQPEGAFSPTHNQFIARSTLPVYQRQLMPERLLREQANQGETVFENNGLRVWTLDNEVLIASFTTKANTINMSVLDGLQHAVSLAENDYKALVLWNPNGEHFSYGADLTMMKDDVANGNFAAINDILDKFQQTSMRLRYAMVPTVAAVRGMVLGGGCELMMHCDHTVAAAESYVGLVEAGVGLLPAGGGTKEFALRAAQQAKHDDLDKYIADAFSTIAMAKTSSSAQEAKDLGYLRDSDTIVFNRDEILSVAIARANALAFSSYRPPMPQYFPAAGIAGIANRKLMLANMLAGNFISEYDNVVAEQIATVLCGGDIDKGSLVDEDWLLRLERDYFVALTKNEKTQARITHTLKTGKPLRN